MKLRATISESQLDIQIREQDSRVLAVVDGREYELERTKSSDRNFLLLHQGYVFDCRVDGQMASGAALQVTVGSNRYVVTLTDPKRLSTVSEAGAHGEGAARILAPMPGKVVRVLVAPGQAVEPGTGIVVVEAMKMQNEMKSPKSGTVTVLNVAVGATVNGGDVLAVIE
ncbi:MAG TPA: biotin/lipoyl-containing protein [Chthoniobacterales bacterium]